MQVNLKESEIAKAVELFLNQKGIETQNKDVTIQFSMGKGANGLKVQIDIEDNPVFPDLSGGVPQAPIKLLTTVQDEPEPSPTSVLGKIKAHTAEVQAAKESPVLTKREAGKQLADISNAAIIAAATPVELPVETPEPAPEVVTTTRDVEVAVAVEEGGEVSDETQGIGAEDQPDVGQPEPEPEPEQPKLVMKKPIFGKKLSQLKEPEPAPVAEATEPPFEGGTKVEPEVAEELAKPAATMPAGPVRRSTASLFKKAT